MTRILDLRGRQHKYGVAPKPDRTYNGRVYHSKKESEYAKQLDLLMHAKGPVRVVRWAPQVYVPLIVNGVTIVNYVADFYVEYDDGRREFHEVKGSWTREARLKFKLFQALYPEKRLIVR